MCADSPIQKLWWTNAFAVCAVAVKVKSIDRTCVGCGNEFVATSPRQKRCRKACGQSFRETHRGWAPKETRFVGIDGEGITENGIHRYVLLSIGDESISRPEGLDAAEIFTFIWDFAQENPETTLVGFFLGYDFTMWFRSLPESRAHSLLHRSGIAKRARTRSGGNATPFPVDYSPPAADGWEFDILAGKRFKLRRQGAKRWVYVCDAGPFFQSSFLTAINPANWKTPVCSDDDYRLIKEGKENRSTAVLGPAMAKYNVAENRVMATLMDSLNRGLVDGCGVRLKTNQWFGPGQAAQAWLDSVSAPTTELMNDVVPVWARRAAQESYFGGWFEIFAHGHVPGVSYEYDLNSAYPAIIAGLPCLLHGRWIQGDGACPKDSGYVLVYGTARGDHHKLGTMSHRTDNKSICRPNATEGWFWRHELEGAMRAGAVDEFVGSRWISYEACDCPAPFRRIANLYQKRLAVGKNSPQGKALKLVYNSVYGKMAQSVGSPKYASAIYASLVTAGCRTRILEAIATHPRGIEDLLMVATDGVYFASPHRLLQISPEKLGAWDASEKTNLTLTMPGVYWDDKTRDYIRRDLPPILKSRGVGAADLARIVPRFDDLWSNWDPSSGEWPGVEVPIRFGLVTARAAMARGDWAAAGSLITQPRGISSWPGTKREFSSAHHVGNRVETDRRRVGSAVWDHETGPKMLRQVSVPYDRSFGSVEEDDLMTPDGSVHDTLRDSLRNEVE